MNLRAIATDSFYIPVLDRSDGKLSNDKRIKAGEEMTIIGIAGHDRAGGGMVPHAILVIVLDDGWIGTARSRDIKIKHWNSPLHSLAREAE